MKCKLCGENHYLAYYVSQWFKMDPDFKIKFRLCFDCIMECRELKRKNWLKEQEKIIRKLKKEVG